MTFPANGPATADQVKAHLQITDDQDNAAIAAVVAAVNARVLSWPVAAKADQDPALPDWTAPDLADLVLGSVMLAARLFMRRNSPDGVAAFGDAGPAYVSRNDPDVALLLQLGSYTRPAVG